MIKNTLFGSQGLQTFEFHMTHHLRCGESIFYSELWRLMHRLPSNSPLAASWQMYTPYPKLEDTRTRQILLESSTRLQQATSSEMPIYQTQQHPQQDKSRTVTTNTPFTPPPEHAMPGTSFYSERSASPRSNPSLSEVCNRNRIKTPRGRGYPFTPSPTPPASGTVWPPSISPM